MSDLTPLRRCTLVAVAIGVSLLCARAAVASMLVSRGDEFARAGALEPAQQFYGRALWFEGTDRGAAERFAFTAFRIRTQTALEAGIRVSSRFLERRPDDRDLLLDRALCYQAARQFAAASRDFTRLARVSGDVRILHLAAWAAYRAGNPAAARTLWRRALRVAPQFGAARKALGRAR